MRLLEYQPLETEIDLRNVNNATCDWAGRCTPIFGGAWEWRNINEKPYI